MKYKLNNSAKFYSSKLGILNSKIIGNSCLNINLWILEDYNLKGSILVLGYGDGELIDGLLKYFKDITLIEGSEKLVSIARLRYKNISNLTIVNRFFEDYFVQDVNKYNAILANHVLEHIDDPVAFLKHSKTWLKNDGIACFTVPNATSLHRRIGVELGMLESVYDLSEQDKVVGHKRVYDMNQLDNDLQNGGYNIIRQGGFNLKLISQKQMLHWSHDLHDAIFKISLNCPEDICSNLFTLCKIKTGF